MNHRPTGPALSLKTCAICGGVSARHAEHVCLRMVDPEARPVTLVKPPSPGLAHEVALAERMNAAGLTGWERQFYWALDERTPAGKPRQYHSDFAFPKAMLLVEVEGQVHGIKRNREADCLRASTAAALGWRMVRVTKDMIIDEGPNGAVALIARALEASS